MDAMGDGQMNDLFDRFLPLLERYLPFDPTATYLITRKLLTRKEYFQLKEEEGKEVYRNGSFVKRLVDVVAGKGPEAFARFFSALEFCIEDSDDSHLGLEYLIGEIKRYLEENGLLHVVAEVDYEERDGGSTRSLTSRCSIRTSYKYSQQSAESLLSKETGYNSEWSLRGSLQHVDSDLVQRHITGFAEQAKFAMQRVTEQIAAPFTEQILFMQKKLDDANECNERNMRIKCELEEENKRLKKDKEELESKVNASLAALVRVETECSNLKQQVENLRIKAKSPDTSPVLSRQISTSSVLSSSSDVSTEGVYYASLSNVDTIPSNDYLYSKEIPSVIFEDQLGEQKKDFSKKKYRLCNIFPRRCKSFNDKKRYFPFYKLRKVCSIPSTIPSHNAVKSLSSTSAQAQSTATTSSDRILMVTTV